MRPLETSKPTAGRAVETLDRAILSSVCALLLLAGPAPAPQSGCVCALAQDGIGGWCDVHQVGYIGSLRITSAMLYEALDAHGHEVNPDSFDCPVCRAAIDSDGFCEEHRIGFVHGLAYFSRLTYELAQGTRPLPSELACATCRRNVQSSGWCDEHRVGMVGGVAIRDPEAFRQVLQALEIVRVANQAAPRCEFCAVAIVTDTRCPICRIQYRDGVAVEREPPAPD